MRSSENEIADGVMEYLSTLPSGEASIRAIKQNLPDFFDLSKEDKAPSPTRKGERVWEQQVRNIVCHRGAPGNYITDGFLDRRPRRLVLTPAGRRRIARGKA